MAAVLHVPRITAVQRRRLDRRRRSYADGLERAVLAARKRVAPGTWTSTVPVQRRAVLAERGLLLELACQVREAHDAPKAALEPVRRLVTDGASPLYYPSGPGALHEAVLEAMLALDHGGRQPA